MITYVPGFNGSYAKRDNNGIWRIHGASNILDEQYDDEYVFKTSLSFEQVKKLPLDTPIYSSVKSFNDNDTTISYETVGDLYQNAQQCLRGNDDQPTYRPYAANNTDALNEVAENIFDGVTWQSYSAYQQDVARDMSDQPDAYPHCFNVND